MIEYFENVKGLKNVKILREKIKKNALISVDGFPMRIRGVNEKNILFKGNVQLVLDREYEEIIRNIEKYNEKAEKFSINEKYDGLSHDSVNGLYDVFVNKLNETIYKKRPANQGANLVKNRELFRNLVLEEKAKVVNEILTMLRCDIATTADLKLVNGGGYAGSIKVNKNTLGKSKLILINQSVTGLFENRIEL